ncbi:MAG: hypothetical protein JNL90_04070 [Planctomycetes bacterium]|nr:hypothetical protein [Planctomycetota bacterium]
MFRSLALVALLALPSCFCCLFSPEVWDQVARSDDAEELAAFDAAYAEQRWDEALDHADEAFDAVGGERSDLLHVQVAECHEKVGDLEAAEAELFRTVRFSQDPAIARWWLRVVEARGRRAAVQQELSRTEQGKDPAIVLPLLLLLQATVDAETWKSTANAAWFGLAGQGNYPETAAVLLLLADFHAEQKSPGESAMMARIASRYLRDAQADPKRLLSWERLQAASLLREARFLVDYGMPWRAGAKLARLADLPPGLAPGFAEERREVEAAAQRGTSADLERRREGFEFPADVTLASALARAKGVTVEPRGELMAVRLPDGREWTVRVDFPNSAGRFDPFRRCLRFEGVVAAPDVALLYPDGDLFLGRDALLGDGLYLSAVRPAALEPCRFGLPFDRANAITDATSFRQQADGSFRVALDFAGGCGFVGNAMRDGDRWLPLGHCLLTLPDWSLYVGKTFEGRPVDGARLLVDGSAEFWSEGQRVEVARRDGSFGNDRFEVRLRDGDEVEYFDRKTGARIAWDNLTYFDTDVDLERLAQWRQSEVQRREREALMEKWAAEERERQRQREAETAELRRSIDEENARLRAERVAQGLSPDFEVPGFDFQGMLDSGGRDDLCVRCNGAGQNYVWGGAQQQLVWRERGASPGGWVDATVHTSGHMAICTLCDGTGIRWGAQR